MDCAGFATLLNQSGLDLTPLEVAEAFWLARIAVPPAEPGHSAAAGAPTAVARGPAAGADQQEAQLPGGLAGPPPGQQANRAEPRFELHLPGGPRDAAPGVAGVAVRVPASTALPGTLGLFRALRPLKARAPDAWHPVLDEAGTADASARAASLVPVFQVGQARPLSLVLVVDTGPAMPVWAKLADELTALFTRLGAFRDVQRWYLRSTPSGALAVSRAAHAPAGGQHDRAELHDPAELRDPAGHQLTLLLTDGAGSAWYSGAIAQALRRWGTSGPVAILQPLPQQLWPRTALAPVRGRLTSTRSGAPNSALNFVPYERRARLRRTLASGPPPMPVPVLEIKPDWLGRWAGFLVGPAGTALDCAVTLAAAGPPVPVSVPQPANDASTAAERLRHFAEQASPEARRLASYLAAVPLHLPVVRHVQQALLPGTGPAHLAEVLLGGIVTTQRAAGGQGEQAQWRYEFAPGVRDLLLNGLGQSEARLVLSTVSRDLTKRFGLGADEFGAFATPSGESPGPLLTELGTVPMASRPFAEIARHVIERITGQFSEAPAEATVTGPVEPAEPDGNQVGLLMRRYQRLGQLADLDEAIGKLRDSGGAPDELATALRLRYLATGETADLDEAVTALWQALAADGPPPRGTLLRELAETLALRHARAGEPADLDAAIEAAREAVELPPPRGAQYRKTGFSGTERTRAVGTLGELLLRRGQASGAAGDLSEALTWLQAATEDEKLAPVEQARLLAAQSTAWRLRADAAPQTRPADLEQAILTMQRAIDCTPRDSQGLARVSRRELAARFAGLGAALLAEARPANADGLRQAADTYQVAVTLVPDADHELASYLAGAGNARLELTLATGAAQDLAMAVATLREAIGQTRPDDRELPVRQAALATALITRFERQGHRGELIEARYLLTEAVARLAAERGRNDSATLSARLLLARADAADGRHTEARAALDALIPQLGPDHRDYRAALALREGLSR